MKIGWDITHNIDNNVLKSYVMKIYTFFVMDDFVRKNWFDIPGGISRLDMG